MVVHVLIHHGILTVQLDKPDHATLHKQITQQKQTTIFLALLFA